MSVYIYKYENVRRLGRHIEHDDRSKSYAYKASSAPRTVRHQRYIPVLNQGNLGACVGFSSVGCLGTGSFFHTVSRSLDNAFGKVVYSLATELDAIKGAYPPNDTGSTGLGGAKALQQLGLISGYQHTLSFADALGAASEKPIITGTNWYSSFNTPDSDGFVTISRTARVEGGHEYCIDEVNVEKEIIGVTNSWGYNWGKAGRFFISFSTYERLLKEDGDATVFTPITVPAPQPEQPEVVKVDPDLLSAYKSILAWAKNNNVTI
jgi:hypothetical protein